MARKIIVGTAVREAEYLADIIDSNNFRSSAPTTLTLAAGAVTLTQSVHAIATEASAASDDWETANGLIPNQWYVFYAADAADTVVIKHAVDNIFSFTGADITLDETFKRVYAQANAAGDELHIMGGGGGGGHDAVTLSAEAGAFLQLVGAGGQEIDLDTQTANNVFAGPTSGGAAKPTFRALVDADIPAAIARDSEVSAAITAHEADTTAAHTAQGVTYTPADASDWNSGADPGDVDDALDQLADRVKAIETVTPERDLAFDWFWQGT